MLTVFQTPSSVGDLHRLAHLKATFTDEENEAQSPSGGVGIYTQAPWLLTCLSRNYYFAERLISFL